MSPIPLIIETRNLISTDGVILVDDCSGLGGALNIDHHVHHSTPERYCKGQTATERVLSALQDGLQPRDYRAAVIRHFDADGALAVWALRNPQTALEYSEDLITAAEYGDFFETKRKDTDDIGLGLSLAVQEATTLMIRQRLVDRLNSNSHVVRLFKEAFRSIDMHIARIPQTDKTHEVLRSLTFDRCANAELLVSGTTVQVRKFHRRALLHSAMTLSNTPIIVLANPQLSNCWEYSVILRPKFSWGYSEDAVGRIPFRTLEGLRQQLVRAEQTRFRNRSHWLERNFDGFIWRLDTYRSSSLTPDQLSAEINDWRIPKHYSEE